jgi:colicin import membrane protein
MNIVALEQLWAKKDAQTVAEQARLTALANPQDLLKLRKKWARGQAIRQAYREKKRALAGQPKPEKPKKPVVYEPWIIAAVRKVQDERTKASHAKQDAKLAAKREAEDAKLAAKLQAKRAAEDAKLEAKRTAKQLVEDAKLEAKRAAEDKRRAQNRAVQAAKRAECQKAADAKTQAEPPAQKARVQFEETEASV